MPQIRPPPPPPLDLEAAALFLDLDGTLLELAESPAAVLVDAEVAELLPALARRLDGALALVTGRTLGDADRLFPGLRLPAAGQHGLVRRTAKGDVRAPAATVGLGTFRPHVARLAERHDGLVIEDKGTSLAIHYRRSPRLAPHVHRTLRALLASPQGERWQLQTGKAIVEIGPRGRDKGLAIREYMGEPPFRGRRPVFAGDDRTDERGFAAVRALGGWAIKVGPGPTCAQYRLPTVAAVRRWLQAALVASGSGAARGS